MMLLPSRVRIYLAREPADMRKSIDGLSALVQQSLRVDIYSGHLFVFPSKRRDRAKILYWDNGGFSLFYNRPCTSRFQRPVLAGPRRPRAPYELSELRARAWDIFRWRHGHAGPPDSGPPPQKLWHSN